MESDQIEARVRDYERQQLVEFLEDLVHDYDEQGMEERAQELARFGDVFSVPYDDDVVEQTHTFDRERWELLTRALRGHADTRAGWLSAKLSRRCRLTPADQGFSTAIPVGFFMKNGIPL